MRARRISSICGRKGAPARTFPQTLTLSYTYELPFGAGKPFQGRGIGSYLPDVRGFSVRDEDVSVFSDDSGPGSTRRSNSAETFYAFNHRHLNAPITDLSDPNFGRIAGQGTARVIQLGFRTTF